MARPLFGSDATSPLFVDLTDDVGTLPLFPDLAPEAGAVPVAEPVTRHAPAAEPDRLPEPGERCDFPEDCPAVDHDPATCEDHAPLECGRPAVVVYVAPPTPSARYTAEYPRCRRHDTKAAQRRADADGITRRAIGGTDA